MKRGFTRLAQTFSLFGILLLSNACSQKSFPCPEPDGGHEKQTMALHAGSGTLTTYKAPKKKNGLLKKSTPSRIKKN
jgi:hypothetical protein